MRVFLVAVVDGPLQLGLGRGQVARVIQHAAGDQRAHLAIGGTPELVFQVGRGALDAFDVARLGGLEHLLVQHRGLAGLLALPVLPAVPASKRQQRGDEHPGQRIAVLAPPGLQILKLFLFF
ncbi:hypothetical protein D3C81_1529700 [compost metagenome]